MNKETSIQKAVRLAGGVNVMAAHLDVHHQQVNQWLGGLRPVPVKYCAVIESLTCAQVTRKHLRPIDWQCYWPELIGGLR